MPLSEVIVIMTILQLIFLISQNKNWSLAFCWMDECWTLTEVCLLEAGGRNKRCVRVTILVQL